MGDFRATLYQHLLRAQERDGVDRLEPTNDPTVSQSITGPKAKREKKKKKNLESCEYYIY